MTITTAEYNNLMATWRKANDNGEGFAVGGDNDTLTDAILREGDTVDAVGQSLAIGKRVDGTRYIVCNSNGPWAVALTA